MKAVIKILLTCSVSVWKQKSWLSTSVDENDLLFFALSLNFCFCPFYCDVF